MLNSYVSWRMRLRGRRCDEIMNIRCTFHTDTCSCIACTALMHSVTNGQHREAPVQSTLWGSGRGVNSEQNAKVKPSAWAALKCRTGICSTGICRTKCRAGKCRTGLVSLLVLHFRSCIFSHPVPHIQHTIKQPPT